MIKYHYITYLLNTYTIFRLILDTFENYQNMSGLVNSTTDIESFPNTDIDTSKSDQKDTLFNSTIDSTESSIMSSLLQPLYTSSSSVHAVNDFSFFKNSNLTCSSPMYRSITSMASEEDPWRASSIGIKCISYKPTSYVFLTRRVLDLYSTDGKRKIDIVYNYSKKYHNTIKTPSIGSSMENCSFCDTITIDFDPSSTFFDLIMEVQIITQGKHHFF